MDDTYKGIPPLPGHMDKEAAKAVASAASPLLRTVAQHQLSKKEIEKQAEMQMELAEKKAEVQEETIGQMEPSSGGSQTASQPDGNVVMDLMEDEDCALCKSLLKRVDRLEGKRREKALAEYGRLKERMQTADKGELKAFVDETEVLEDLLDDVV